MWRCLAQPLDRLAIRSACGSVLPSPDGHSHAAEAVALLQRPDFLCPSTSVAALEFTGTTTFQFPSTVCTGSVANDLVRGHCVLAGADWRKRPSVILLHGWNAELQYEWLLPRWSRVLARAGISAFRFELPYHAARRPGAGGGISNFLSGHLLHFAQATHQALADTRALALWLRAQGSPTVGLWGVSLGGWLAGLAVAHQPEINTAVLLTPVVRMERALQELAFFDPIRASLAGLETEFRSLNLVAHPAPTPGKHTLVVASQFDLFAPMETIDELERAWRPEVWRVPHSHISVLLSGAVTQRIVPWLATKARQGGRN